jgi:DNA (cytosine-5)-methyltransferase 1
MCQTENSLFSLTTEMTPKVDENGTAFSLRSRDYKDPQCVAYRITSHPKSKEDGQGWQETDVNDTLNAFDNGETRTPTLLVENHPNDSRVKIREDGIVQTLNGRMGTGGGNVPLVMNTYQNTTGALCASGYEKLGTQEACNDMFVVQSSWDGSQVAPTLTQNNAGGGQRMPDKDNFNAVITPSQEEPRSIVRRLTPKECERLQGYPDGWTDIGEWVDSKGKKHKDADSPRYKALGNSICLPFWSWMAGRMVEILKQEGIEKPTMASLFDGIGGFPLVFSQHGCTPVWASEIEEFPIAVTKLRFPEDGKININTDTANQGNGSSERISSKPIYTHGQNDTWVFTDGEQVQTLSAAMGNGGGNIPLLMETKQERNTNAEETGISAEQDSGKC